MGREVKPLVGKNGDRMEQNGRKRQKAGPAREPVKKEAEQRTGAQEPVPNSIAAITWHDLAPLPPGLSLDACIPTISLVLNLIILPSILPALSTKAGLPHHCSQWHLTSLSSKRSGPTFHCLGVISSHALSRSGPTGGRGHGI
jgi:hypothetical protein